ncbi:MAG: sulfotransferase [Gammaproteobacteria bacterium]|nr:sulfotransferase [Gammaproteobacteria bacterium]|tara:strand:- start:811 stop:1656 length:846 start_codon:yes stop_codon:yes gene_type:complete
MKMDFIGIGAQKCASTWISAVLRAHPGIAMPADEPLDFFSYRFENGYRWYDVQVASASADACRGEMSQSYFHEPGVVERVREYRDDIKIVVSLRDPVERALSQHRHLVRLGAVPSADLSFETALATNPTYREQGLYFRHLSRWLEAFGQDRVHITLMDDIRTDPDHVARSLYRFLGVDDDYAPQDLNETRNESYVVRSRATHRVMGGLSRTVRSVGGETVWRSLGGSSLRRFYRKLNHRRVIDVIPDPDPSTLAELRAFYAADLGQLGALLQRDLTTWANP